LDIVIMITLLVIACCFIIGLIFIIPLLIDARRASQEVSKLARTANEELVPMMQGGGYEGGSQGEGD